MPYTGVLPVVAATGVSVGLINGLPALNTISILLAKVCDDQGVPTVTENSYLLAATNFPPETK